MTNVLITLLLLWGCTIIYLVVSYLTQRARTLNYLKTLRGLIKSVDHSTFEGEILLAFRMFPNSLGEIHPLTTPFTWSVRVVSPSGTTQIISGLKEEVAREVYLHYIKNYEIK
jgi:hypothetical protein